MDCACYETDCACYTLDSARYTLDGAYQTLVCACYTLNSAHFAIDGAPYPIKAKVAKVPGVTKVTRVISGGPVPVQQVAAVPFLLIFPQQQPVQWLAGDRAE